MRRHFELLGYENGSTSGDALIEITKDTGVCIFDSHDVDAKMSGSSESARSHDKICKTAASFRLPSTGGRWSEFVTRWVQSENGRDFGLNPA